MSEQEWKPTFSPWRHGGWYVNNIRYTGGGVGCVSRNYRDRKWRIVCDRRPFEYAPTFANRVLAARAERDLTLMDPRVLNFAVKHFTALCAFYETSRDFCSSAPGESWWQFAVQSAERKVAFIDQVMDFKRIQDQRDVQFGEAMRALLDS